jgi:hypothetical protein
VTTHQNARASTAPPPPETPFGDQAPGIVDGRPALREFIAENLHLASYEADSAWRCAEIGDDSGLRYHVRRMVAHTKQVASSTNDLRTVNDPAPAETARAS